MTAREDWDATTRQAWDAAVSAARRPVRDVREPGWTWSDADTIAAWSARLDDAEAAALAEQMIAARTAQDRRDDWGATKVILFVAVMGVVLITAELLAGWVA